METKGRRAEIVLLHTKDNRFGVVTQVFSQRPYPCSHEGKRGESGIEAGLTGKRGVEQKYEESVMEVT